MIQIIIDRALLLSFNVLKDVNLFLASPVKVESAGCTELNKNSLNYVCIVHPIS